MNPDKKRTHGFVLTARFLLIKLQMSGYKSIIGLLFVYAIRLAQKLVFML